MIIQFVTKSQIPAKKYGGKERALWSLLKALKNSGHKLKLIAPIGSVCPFADITPFDPKLPIEQQIDSRCDIVHFDYPLHREFEQKPYLCRQGGNGQQGEIFAKNTVFVSRNSAHRHGGEYFILNGIDAEEYGDPALNMKREYVHFLAKAAWKVKNLKGSIEISKMAGEHLEVIGGNRINFKMGFRVTLSLHVNFNGIIGGEKKLNIIRGSKALLYPVLWHEPCANAVFESLYYGCPVFGTTWGFLPEIINKEMGFLTNSKSAMAEALKNASSFNRKAIHEHLMEHHSIARVANEYMKAYELILEGKTLNAKTPVAIIPEPAGYFKMVE
ncbi:MAG: glycosyltransferase [Bacteroidales bacterium]|nr:glycosyltransferase [Bacteroidales bacterium]MBN2819839.1 glycosyltransferase [Bacteroidales bacterium]